MRLSSYEKGTLPAGDWPECCGGASDCTSLCPSPPGAPVAAWAACIASAPPSQRLGTRYPCLISRDCLVTVTPSSSPLSEGHTHKESRDERFTFGENGEAFLRVLDHDRIENGQRAWADLRGTADLNGKSFLDISSGSGLSTLVARRMSARVTCFDYGPSSEGCTQELRRRNFPDDPDRRVKRGSALDPAYRQGGGTRGGLLFVGIYTTREPVSGDGRGSRNCIVPGGSVEPWSPARSSPGGSSGNSLRTCSGGEIRFATTPTTGRTAA